MRRDLNLTLNTRTLMSSLATGVLASLGAHASAATAESGAASEGTYTWSAELVALNEEAGTAAVQSRVVGHADLGAIPALDEGDPIVITWSGITQAAGIRSVTAGTRAESDRFTLPAEFVSFEDDRYLTFEVQIPSDAVETQSLTEGEWVTLTSPHQPSDPSEAVEDIRPYNDVANDELG